MTDTRCAIKHPHEAHPFKYGTRRCPGIRGKVPWYQCSRHDPHPPHRFSMGRGWIPCPGIPDATISADDLAAGPITTSTKEHEMTKPPALFNAERVRWQWAHTSEWLYGKPVGYSDRPVLLVEREGDGVRVMVGADLTIEPVRTAEQEQRRQQALKAFTTDPPLWAEHMNLTEVSGAFLAGWDAAEAQQ